MHAGVFVMHAHAIARFRNTNLQLSLKARRGRVEAGRNLFVGDVDVATSVYRPATLMDVCEARGSRLMPRS
jgi:hypothetical protein